MNSQGQSSGVSRESVHQKKYPQWATTGLANWITTDRPNEVYLCLHARYEGKSKANLSHRWSAQNPRTTQLARPASSSIGGIKWRAHLLNIIEREEEEMDREGRTNGRTDGAQEFRSRVDGLCWDGPENESISVNDCRCKGYWIGQEEKQNWK